MYIIAEPENLQCDTVSKIIFLRLNSGYSVHCQIQAVQYDHMTSNVGHVVMSSASCWVT